jgi:hypothetical protein
MVNTSGFWAEGMAKVEECLCSNTSMTKKKKFWLQISP